ncbi:WD repeat-containing protein 90 [Aplysia californica]|uniref:WD repeat-containing protein 90 n=1 Tax=Aplysia californica TaxID=6500 RepID=A0ABM1W425_APLCA|nr:WD repeat-containing protein 90 [Aplysia californica]
MDNLWQSPFVNVFKHFNLPAWKKATKEGEVSSLMDKTVKGTVYKISGSIPAGNYVQLPKTNTQSLGLTGRYFYLLFRPVPSKHFVVHLDVATADSLVIRVSFSSLFKAFKSTSTWLQFPYVCSPAPGPVPAYAADAARDQSGPAPMVTRWTLLCLDLQHVLSTYLNRRFLYVKSVRLCANMMVKNVFTSDTLYDPGLTMVEAKRQGLTAQGICPLPRDMSYPLAKGDTWHDSYDWIRFPNDSSRKPFDSIQPASPRSRSKQGKTALTANKSDVGASGPQRIQARTVDVSKCVSDRVSMIHKLTTPKQGLRNQEVTSELPELPACDRSENRGQEIHVFAHPDQEHHPRTQPAGGGRRSLEPDPIMKLKRIIGFGGATYRDALWSADGACVVYPCHAVVVAMTISSGLQRFFIGHTDKVSCLSMTSSGGLVASGQTGQMSAVRVWKFSTGECLAIGKVHVHSLSCLSFSAKGAVLCGVGKDNHGKNLVVVWSTSRVARHREMSVMAKAHTDVDISRILVAGFDDTKMVSCGRDNVRLWRVREGALRSAPVSLGEYHAMEFTDVCFEACAHMDTEPENRLFYACTKSGHIFEMDYNKLTVQHVRRLLPSKSGVGRGSKMKDSGEAGGSLSLTSMHLNDTFCVTGSDDGYLRLWPLDFAHVYLEAEHEGPVTASRLSADGLKILAGTSKGNLGVLDVSTRAYTTLMRSHTGRVACFAVDPMRRHLATVSDDGTIRVWDADTLQQLYDFSAPDETPVTINYHPSRQLFACGFHSGTVRVFNVENTSLVAEHRQLRGQVTGLVFSPDGARLYSCCSLGVAAIFDACTPGYKVLRVIAGLVARGEGFGPQALAVSPCGRRVAFIGPSQYTVTIADAKCLDELVRIDVSSVGSGSGHTPNLDSAQRVTFTPTRRDHLLVSTANNKLVKYDARSGRLVSEVDHIHRSACSALTVSDCGKYLATGGDKTIKIWDYDMKLDINFQVFIGHSENVSRVHFTPDGLGLVSGGEAVYLWDFLVRRPPTPPVEGRMDLTDIEEVSTRAEIMSVDDEEELTAHQGAPLFPRPATTSISPRSDDIDALSSIHGASDSEDTPAVVSSNHKVSGEPGGRGRGPVGVDHRPGRGPVGVDHRPARHDPRADTKDQYVADQNMSNGPTAQSDLHTWSEPGVNGTAHPDVSRGLQGRKLTGQQPRVDGVICPPSAFVHYRLKDKAHGVAQRRYTAPAHQAGLRLRSVIGYNCHGRNNMSWHPDTGLFAYTAGCVIVIEDLNSGDQKYLQGHMEEVNCLALSHSGRTLVSASPTHRDVPCQMCVWDIHGHTCSKVLTHHRWSVQCLAFSRDDRFLVSVGDYRESSVVVWDSTNYQVLATSVAAWPIHGVRWDPLTVNEFVSVGERGSVLFWLLDESAGPVCLNVHQAHLPPKLDTVANKGKPVTFTSLAYAGDSTAYIGTQSGHVSAWDTRHNTCFLHWEADSAEITQLVCRHSRLMTASAGHAIKLWSVAGVSHTRPANGRPAAQGHTATAGLTMEDEMALDGPITCAEFDDTLDMGIVGTGAGTLWYINWSERSSIRLVAGHGNKIHGATFTPDNLLVSGGDDGSVRVWSVRSREQVLQFQVKLQSCTCLAARPASEGESGTCPLVVGGYSDGTLRLFDLSSVEMLLKLQPHAVTVTAVCFSADGAMILSGASDGLIAVSSPSTGMTVRIISDHKGVAISNMDVTLTKEVDVGVSAPTLWLASSADRRVSVWSADWASDFCELVDWMTFPGPAVMPDGTRIRKNDTSHYALLPPTLARFSPHDADIIVYTGYGMECSVHFYSLTSRKVLRTARLTQWALDLAVSPDSSLVAVGIAERLVKLMDYNEGSFQDFLGHSAQVTTVQFSPSGSQLLTVCHNEMFLWELML